MLTATEIKAFNLFKGLEDFELEEIARLCVRQTYTNNEIIFDPNDRTDDVYLLEGGNESVQIEISLDRHSSKADPRSKLVIHTLSKGETFGWAPLCPVQIRTATVRVIDKADVIKVNGSALKRLFEENNHIGYVVMKNLSSIISLRLDAAIIAFRHILQQAKMS